MSRRPARKNGYLSNVRQAFDEDVEPLRIERLRQHGDAGDASAGLRRARSHPLCDRIVAKESAATIGTSEDADAIGLGH